ncbi:MAG: NUMOD1 domain-containing DNA-binding protein, partial [Ginsengibacter sp.]
MFYFKKIIINKLTTQNIEDAIRNYSSKRHTSLDLKTSSSYIKEHKYFLGLEGNTDLKITRI